MEIERRRQTQHKLEVMQQYWGAYCAILARAGSAYFCSRHIWLIDTHAARGLHASAGDPDGFVAGTPLQAVLAARGVQEHFPDMVAPGCLAGSVTRSSISLRAHPVRRGATLVVFD